MSVFVFSFRIHNNSFHFLKVSIKHFIEFFSTQPFDFKNIDRESAQDMEVTVNGVTVTITDYQIVLPDSNKNEDQE